jgi:hypothetical protein
MRIAGEICIFFKYIFFGVPHLATCIFLFLYNEPELGAGIDPGMALTPLPSSIGWELNPRPSDREPSALPLDHSFCLRETCILLFQNDIKAPLQRAQKTYF